MSLKTLFKNTCQSVTRYFEDQQIKGLEGTRALAEQGFGHVVARGGAIKVRISEEEAQKIIGRCDASLQEIAKKRANAATPQP